MFTGLVEAVGELLERKPTIGGFRLRIASSLAPELARGDSLAVNGVCLTVIVAERREIHADVAPETVRVTTLGALARGSRLNLERPMRADSRFGGHFVQGHVDATGTVEELRQDGESYWLTVMFPAALAPYIVRKGSIAVNGISLTVAGVDDRRFDVQIIPYTWTHTNLQTTRAGDAVNLECDILGKYVARSLELTNGSARQRSQQQTP
jgi:riboflavin synthase